MLHDEYNKLRSVDTKAPVFGDVFNSQVSISVYICSSLSHS